MSNIRIQSANEAFNDSKGWIKNYIEGNKPAGLVAIWFMLVAIFHAIRDLKEK